MVRANGTRSWGTEGADDGVTSWQRSWGSTKRDEPFALARDRQGALYVTGLTQGSIDGQPHQGTHDLFLTKLSSDGHPQWTRLLGKDQADWGSGAALAGHAVLPERCAVDS
jgi:hypothetical protein